MDEPLPLFVPDREVGPKAAVVLKETIGSHLGAPPSAGPALCSADEPTTDSAPADVGIDVPAFDVADWARVACVCVWADGRLHESGQASIRTRGDVGHGRLLEEVLVHLLAVSLCGLLGPKGGAHAQPLRSIALDGATDLERLLCRLGHRVPMDRSMK